MADAHRFLASLRVLDVGGADSDAVGRLLGDLGADVLKIEPPGGTADRIARPTRRIASRMEIPLWAWPIPEK